MKILQLGLHKISDLFFVLFFFSQIASPKSQSSRRASHQPEGVVWFSVCEAPLDNWANGGSVDVFLQMVSMVLVLLVVGLILGNGYRI